MYTPSFFARIIETEQAFRFVCNCNLNNDDYMYFESIINNWLDVFEFIFYYGDTISAYKLSLQDLEVLNDGIEKHEKLKEIIEEDFYDLYKEENFITYLLVLDGIVLAGTSPLTVIYLSPDAEKKWADTFLRNRRIFTELIPLEKRDIEFQKYLLFYSSQLTISPIIKDYIKQNVSPSAYSVFMQDRANMLHFIRPLKDTITGEDIPIFTQIGPCCSPNPTKHAHNKWEREDINLRINQTEEDKFSLLNENLDNAVPIISPAVSSGEDIVCCSVFAPAYVQIRKRLFIQVYLHIVELEAMVNKLAHEADYNTERRKYKSLSGKIKRGAEIEVVLVIENEEEVYRETQHLIWQRPFVECTFKYKVPKDLPEDELSCDVHVVVDGIVVGRLSFLTAITDIASQTNAEVLAIPTQCVFISYAHKDAEQVQFLAEGYRALDNLEYFFDRHKLKPGDEFESKIFEFIDKSDLFILCWSKNAAESEWVTKERLYAFKKYIESKGGNSKRIRIYPVNIKPSADLPTDMGNILNFGQLI